MPRSHCGTRLGYEEELATKLLGKVTDSTALHAFFVRWLDQPAASEMPAVPELYDGPEVRLRSKLLGCSINVVSQNSPPCVELGESVLAALESLASTGLEKRMVAREPLLDIVVGKSDVITEPFTFDLQEINGKPRLSITCRDFNPHNVSLQDQRNIKTKLMELLFHLFDRVFMVQDFEETITELGEIKRTFERSIDFTGSFCALGNVFRAQAAHDPLRMGQLRSPGVSAQETTELGRSRTACTGRTEIGCGEYCSRLLQTGSDPGRQPTWASEAHGDGNGIADS